jgi:DNA-binding response OmpR family regulator
MQTQCQNCPFHVAEANPKITIGSLSINFDLHEVRRAGSRIKVTPKELSVFECLLKKTNKVVSRESLLSALYGWDCAVDDSDNTIELYISRLRKWLADEPVEIKTIRGIGYALTITHQTPLQII